MVGAQRSPNQRLTPLRAHIAVQKKPVPAMYGGLTPGSPSKKAHCRTDSMNRMRFRTTMIKTQNDNMVTLNGLFILTLPTRPPPG